MARREDRLADLMTALGPGHDFARARPGSALVTVSSTLGFTPKPELGVYSATKAFVTSFSETLWHEQKARGVHVPALRPGGPRYPCSARPSRPRRGPRAA